MTSDLCECYQWSQDYLGSMTFVKVWCGVYIRLSRGYCKVSGWGSHQSFLCKAGPTPVIQDETWLDKMLEKADKFSPVSNKQTGEQEVRG
jgi:hypothetical protein